MISLNINGERREVDVDPQTPLLWVLRDTLGMTGTKYGCGISQCGACTVHVDGAATRTCVTPVATVADTEITTIEGLGADAPGGLHPLQQAWLEDDVVQCGYCQSGQIMSAAELIATTPEPTEDDINTAMSGNICRCGTYGRIRCAIKKAAAAMRGEAVTK